MKFATNIELQDIIKIPSKRKLTDSGQMIVPCAFARTGVQKYSAGQLGLKDMDPTTMVDVYRKDEDVFHEESISSFRSSPVTLGHPKELVTSENSEKYQVGMLEGMPVRVDDTLSGNLVLTSQKAIDALDDGMQELSAGYTCDLVTDEEDKIFQTNIRANHIAIVKKGRAGSACRIADEDTGVGEDDGDVDTEVVAELQELRDSLEESKSSLEAMKDAMEEIKAEAEKDKAQYLADMDTRVLELVDTITQAKEISSIKDFSGKSVEEIRRAVVEERCTGVSIADKDDSYVAARFDILVEGTGETPMGKLIRDTVSDSAPAKPADPAAEARKRMIDRQTKKTQ